MKRMLPAEELARDERFVRTDVFARVRDPRPMPGDRGRAPLTPATQGAPERARVLMHGIFTGEIQALEGAGRTCWDFPVGDGEDEAPFALKLDMARQCWDEARHCEISVKLGDWMGTEIGEFAESAFLYEAACNPDPVLRLTGVNRALEGLAIDVFNTIREFGRMAGDPVLDFCEDWMLADEVTHVKMGSDWLRRLTADDPERRERALEFQRVVDKLFSLGGVRGEEDDSPIKLARRFRELAGFADDEIDEIAGLALEARTEMAEQRAVATSRQGVVTVATVTPETFTMVLYDHDAIAAAVDEVVATVGFPADEDVRVEVDEANPLARTHLLSIDPVVIAVDGGAFEDPRHPRQLSTDFVSVVVGRLILQAMDRRDPAFGDPPPADAMPVAHRVAWDVYTLGRLGRKGYPAQRQRRLYNFRNRHGFTDVADASFERLWSADDLTWADITELSDSAAAARPERPS